MTQSIHIRKDSLKRQLEIHRNNLLALEERAAMFGIEVPVATLNEIDYAKQQIENTARRLADLENAETPEEAHNIEISVDESVDVMLRSIQTVQIRMDILVKAFAKDHERLNLVWQRVNPSLRHRLSTMLAAAFIVLVLSLWYIKDFRDALLAFPILGVIITISLALAAPAVYFVGRDYNHVAKKHDNGHSR